MQTECQEIRVLPNGVVRVIEIKENFAKFYAERGKKMSENKGSDDMSSKAKRWWKSDVSPVEFCAEAWLEVTYGILSPTC